MTSFKIYDKFMTFTLITFSISLVGLVAYVFSNNTAYAQQPLNLHSSQNNTSNPNILSVTGTANTKVKPDKVILSLGVETNNKTANAALVANSKVMNKVIDALKTAG
ncbi:MAG TPA: SIMPL domain-containing protein, partial [Nitrososphaeraceae archaeon]